MKKLILFSLLFLTTLQTFPDRYISRGPAIGEIYFIGPTYTGLGLYHSTDFGQTAICVDSTFTTNIMSITADKTQGVIYYVNMQGGLYRSDNYGIQNSWQYCNSNIYIYIKSGVDDGYIYNTIASHSEDYGNSFETHSNNGFFGSILDIEIDNEPDKGYTIVKEYGIPDTLFLLFTHNNFDSLEIIKTFKMNSGFGITISRGIFPGEIFIYNKYEGRLIISNDFGETWYEINYYNLSSIGVFDIVGGRTEGEMFVYYKFINMAWQNAHTYIFHSTDNGISYEVFHPFAKGQEPLLANFSAKSENDAKGIYDIKTIDSVYYVTGDMPLNVQFYNYSIGDINLYEWDFNNDGTVDSYEESPSYTYADTGWFSVNLTVYDDYDTNSFIRENYIYVYELTGTDEMIKFEESVFSCFPIPFSDKLNITITNSSKSNLDELLIFDIKGNIVKHIFPDGNYVVWDGYGKSGVKCSPGIYFLKFKNYNYTEKILLTN